jgi:hypothetical protein
MGDPLVGLENETSRDRPSSRAYMNAYKDRKHPQLLF